MRRLHHQGRRAICYLDVGSWESYRPDASAVSALGARPALRRLPRRALARHPPLPRASPRSSNAASRICARKSFDAVEPDNLAGFENKTGFPLTAADQLRFNRWVARRVHAFGMAVALKNDPTQAEQLVGDFDFAIVEQCFQYRECGLYRTFVDHGKAVFEAEYELDPAEYCDQAAPSASARSASPTTSSPGPGGPAPAEKTSPVRVCLRGRGGGPGGRKARHGPKARPLCPSRPSQSNQLRQRHSDDCVVRGSWERRPRGPQLRRVPRDHQGVLSKTRWGTAPAER